MLVVVDASVIVHALTKFDSEGDELREWLLSLTGGRRLEMVRNLARVEFLDLLAMLHARGAVSFELATEALRNHVSIPARHHDLTQPMAVRIFEMRNQASVYAAANIALVERLQAEERTDAIYATLNPVVASANLTIRVELFG